jgi:hypothetical protein
MEREEEVVPSFELSGSHMVRQGKGMDRLSGAPGLDCWPGLLVRWNHVAALWARASTNY